MRWRGNESKVGKYIEFLTLLKERRVNGIARSHRGPGESCILSFLCDCHWLLLLFNVSFCWQTCIFLNYTCSAPGLGKGVTLENYLLCSDSLWTMSPISAPIELWQFLSLPLKLLITPFQVSSMLSRKSCSHSSFWQRAGTDSLFSQNLCIVSAAPICQVVVNIKFLCFYWMLLYKGKCIIW